MQTGSMTSILRPTSFPPEFITPSRLTPTVARHIGVAALAGEGKVGEISRLANEAGVSRQTVYTVKNAVDERLRGLFEEGTGYGPEYFTVKVDRAQIERAIVGARCSTPSSLRDIMDLFPVFYNIEAPSYGFVQSTIKEAERNAVSFMERLDVRNARTGALDEIFNHSEPILEVVDLKSEAILALKLTGSRGKEDWSGVLSNLKDRGFLPECFISDNALGISSSVKETYQGKPHRKDGFHVLARFAKRLHQLERSGYKAIAGEYAAEALRSRRPRNSNLHKLGQDARYARERAERAMYAHDRFLELHSQLVEALEFVDVKRLELKAPSDCANELKEVVRRLKADRSPQNRKLGTYLRNQIDGLIQYMEELNDKLRALANTPEELAAVTAMAAMWRINRMLGMKHYAHAHSELCDLGAKCLERLTVLSPERIDILMNQVMTAIEERYRASSLVECINSVIRPILSVRKHVTEGALALFAAWWNLHPRTSGPLEETCPYTLLTGRVVKDWLSELGFPPGHYMH